MTNKLSVTIGIPAYNEAANIGQLLGSVLTQQGDNFILERVLVVSDGSTDSTAQQVRTITDPRLKLIEHRDRQGQAQRQNEILVESKTDILLLLNADIAIKDPDFILNMIKPFLDDSNVGMVAARILPLPAENFFENVINSSVFLKLDIFENLHGGNNIMLCNGRARAFSREFSSQLSFIPQPGEDGYSYIKCMDLGYKFIYQRTAEIFYRSPQTLPDHLKQSKRFFRSVSLHRSMNNGENKKYYKVPLILFFRKLFRHTVRHPVLLLCYSAVFIIARVSSMWYETSTVWEVSLSSKIISK